jgi:aryl-alcohol dehydrogenase-like predicted oxidoreductase
LASRVAIPVIGYSVMARGALAGKNLDRQPGDPAASSWPDDRAPWQIDATTAARIRRLIDLAAQQGATTTSLLIADALRLGPCAGILTSASSPSRIEDIVAGIRLANQPGSATEVAALFDGSSD